MRWFLGLLLVALIAAALFSGSRAAYDRGYAAGFEQGAVDTTEAIDRAGDRDPVVQVVAPDRFRGPGYYGPGFGFLFLLFPLFLLFVVLGGARRAWRGGWGPGSHDPRARLERWHEHAHAPSGASGGGDDADWPATERDGGST